MLRRALFPGRFQPFHIGHLKAVERILREEEEVVIAVGSAQYSHTLENPFTAGERIEAIRLALVEDEIDLKRCMILAVPDTGAHSLWVPYVTAICPSFSVVYTNNGLVRRLFKESGVEVRGVPFFKRNIFSSTEIRKRILSEGNWKKLVPGSVAEFLENIDAEARIKEIEGREGKGAS